ncbi:MAG TPA: hypothetical protein VFO36_07125 [Nitrospiraceae bacterium]|nr:hypothetical protein [Nitrospiraceae bacterium]
MAAQKTDSHRRRAMHSEQAFPLALLIAAPTVSAFLCHVGLGCSRLLLLNLLLLHWLIWRSNWRNRDGNRQSLKRVGLCVQFIRKSSQPPPVFLGYQGLRQPSRAARSLPLLACQFVVAQGMRHGGDFKRPLVPRHRQRERHQFTEVAGIVPSLEDVA